MPTDLEDRVRDLEKKVWMIAGGIAVVTVLAGTLFVIAQGEFVKKEGFELRAVEAAQKHNLAGAPGERGKDGISVPVGGIVAWAAAAPPLDDAWYEQWRICNGDEIALSVVSKEFAEIIGDRYGKARPGYVKLPNYQGYFLRGLDASGGVDPDRAGKDVGSKQDHQLAEHSHYLGHWTGPPKYDLVHTKFMNKGTPSVSTNAFGGKETRPVNIAVHWIIRVK